MTGGAIEIRLRHLLPMLTLFLAALLDLAAIPSAAPRGWFPDLLATSLFFWCLHRPELVPAPALFALALVSDLVAGSMIGLTPLTLLILREAVIRQQLVLLALSPAILWAAFAAHAAALGTASWTITSVHAGHRQDPIQALGDMLLTVIVWPIVSLVLTWLQSSLPRVRHAAGS